MPISRASIARKHETLRQFGLILFVVGALGACNTVSEPAGKRSLAAASKTASPGLVPTAPIRHPEKVERKASAMSTSVTFIAYTGQTADRGAVDRAIDAALSEMLRLEMRVSEWRDDSEVSRINLRAGSWVNVGVETRDVIAKALWAGRISEGAFDITFQVMSDLWKFGSASDSVPRLPSPEAVRERRALIDYRKVELDSEGSRVRLAKGRRIGLGGIAKGYIVDQSAAVLRKHGVTSFLVQAGGDLYGAGRKPDGSPWVSGIQDPRGPHGTFFATIELEDRAFSTAGDYARSYLVDRKRYHHIIDPRTGYPATQCRSVTVWAKDAITADAIDDAVFVLGPERGLKLAESVGDVGVVIVDGKNKIWSSPELAAALKVLKAPTDAP